MPDGLVAAVVVGVTGGVTGAGARGWAVDERDGAAVVVAGVGVVLAAPVTLGDAAGDGCGARESCPDPGVTGGAEVLAVGVGVGVTVTGCDGVGVGLGEGVTDGLGVGVDVTGFGVGVLAGLGVGVGFAGDFADDLPAEPSTAAAEGLSDGLAATEAGCS